MPKCSEVATELRKLADALDKEPDTVMLNAYCALSLETKESFLAVARVFPKPFWKVPNSYEYKLDNRPHTSDGTPDYKAAWSPLHTVATVPRNVVCELVEPAKPAVYRCEPLLSEAEDAAISEGVQ